MYGLPAEARTPQGKLRRQFLHAHSLELRRYPDNASCTFVAPLADDLVVWMQLYFPTGLGAIHDDKTISS